MLMSISKCREKTSTVRSKYACGGQDGEKLECSREHVCWAVATDDVGWVIQEAVRESLSARIKGLVSLKQFSIFLKSLDSTNEKCNIEISSMCYTFSNDLIPKRRANLYQEIFYRDPFQLRQKDHFNFLYFCFLQEKENLHVM